MEQICGFLIPNANFVCLLFGSGLSWAFRKIHLSRSIKMQEIQKMTFSLWHVKVSDI